MENSLVSLNRVSYRYPSGTNALDEVSLHLPKGKKIALLGANGAGKSTLMLLLNGILKPSSGHLLYRSAKYRYQKKHLNELRRKVGILFQESDNQLIAPTVYEEISFGLTNLFNDKELIRQKIEKSITEFCLEEIRSKSPHQLSSGQKKRVCLAAVLAMEPELMVCDEPSANLDYKHAEITFKILNRLHAQGKTILISTHDVNRAYQWADYIVIMKGGKIISTGIPQNVFANRKLVQDAMLNQPFLVEAAQALVPDISASDLPKNMNELQQVLNTVPC